MGLSYTQITGTFDDGSGGALSGFATFTPSAALYASGVPVVQPDVPVQAQITAGSLKNASGGTLQLLDLASTPIAIEGQTGFWFWTVQIVIGGQAQAPWSFFLEHSGAPVDLYSLANTPAGGGGGTVTSVAVESANGLGGTVADSTTTPQITLGTTVTGLLKGNGTAISAAAAGTDYLAPAGSGAALTGITAAQVGADASGAAAAAQSAAETYAATVAASAQAAAEAASVPLSDLPLALAHGGTGQTTQQSALDALAGAQTAGEYLRGNGTHLGMSPIQAADVPGVNGVTVSGTPSAGNVLTATSGSAADWGAPASAWQPWQFLPETYGAQGDGRVIGDAVISGGSLSTLTSATAAFTSADNGKHIIVNDAGPGSLPLCTTVTYVSATAVTLGTAASGAVTNAAAFVATDDTAAINSAVSAAAAYALAHQYFAEVVLGAKYYGAASAPVQAGNGSSTPTFNAQIPLPYPAANGTSQKLVIALTGAGDGSQCQYFESTVPNLQGTCLVSMVQAPSQPDATFGWQSVIGGPSGSAGFTGHFANTKLVLTGVSVWTPLISRQYAIDLRYIGGMRIDKSSAQAFGSVAGGQIPLPNLPGLTSFQNALSVGLFSPAIGNNDDLYVGSFAAEGFTTGVQADDHFTAARVACIYANIGLELNATSGASGVSHRVTIANYSCEASNAAISCNGGTMPVDITMSCEVINTADVQDNGNALLGEIRWYSESETVPAVQGGAHVRIVNDTMSPGLWSGAPAVPATTVAQQNTSYRDATVYLTSGGAAVTVIKVDSTTTGLTLGTTGTVAVRVPSGHSYTLTYASTAPTAVWMLD